MAGGTPKRPDPRHRAELDATTQRSDIEALPAEQRVPRIEAAVLPGSAPRRSAAGPDDAPTVAAFSTSMRGSLETLIRLIERVAPGMRGSVLLLDEDGVTLRHGAAPNLPAAYCRLIDGERIGPAAGSCGTAAYRRERVIVRDIATDPLWAAYRQAAEPFGLAACWSTPIFDLEGHVLGTFAMYYQEPREPTAADLQLTETAALLAANIITRARALAALRVRTEDAERLAMALQESETRYHQMADSVPDQVWTATPDGQLDYVNGRVLEYFGRDFEHMIGEGWQDVVHPADLPRVIERWTHSLLTGAGYQVEFRLRRRDGEYRHHIGRALPMRDAEGRIVRWFGTNTDITELREAELARDHALAEAKAERERLYEVFMQAPAAITVFEGPNHVFTVANPRYRELVGGREIDGRPIREALPELEGQGVFELLDAAYTWGEPCSARERVVRLERDGVKKDLYLDFVYQPMKDARGRTFAIMAHAVEVTEQVRAREGIVAARAEAEHANQAKSAFLAAMSHDLRTPINAISGYAELTETGIYGAVTDAQRDAMAHIRRAGDHLLTLINDILSFARIEAGSIRLEPADLPVDELLLTAGAMIKLQAAKKGLSFETHPAPAGVRVRADRERTIEILANLLTNAAKFTEEGSVALDCHGDDRTVRFQVRDTGRGIPDDRVAAIFDPFVQVGASEEDHRQGVGLGLAISRQLARAMGGDLTVESTLGRGSTFTLTLPRVADG